MRNHLKSKSLMWGAIAAAALAIGCSGGGKSERPDVDPTHSVASKAAASQAQVAPPVNVASSAASTPDTPAAPEEPVDKKDRYYSNCAAAKAAGAAPLRRGQDGGYRGALDRDGDGIACDK